MSDTAGCAVLLTCSSCGQHTSWASHLVRLKTMKQWSTGLVRGRHMLFNPPASVQGEVPMCELLRCDTSDPGIEQEFEQ